VLPEISGMNCLLGCPSGTGGSGLHIGHATRNRLQLAMIRDPLCTAYLQKGDALSED
jgi:hypothetical protein